MKFKDSPRKMAEDLDNAMYDLDPYEYMDAVCDSGEDLETSRRRNRSALTESIKLRDRRILEGVAFTSDRIDETEDRSLRKRFRSILSRLENHYSR